MIRETLVNVNCKMNRLWHKTGKERFNMFRTFFMGNMNKDLFPNGVIYRGVSTTPFAFRGPSGAYDSILPTMDQLL
jgi:indoleamine 2,3-dioxygenase